MIYDIYLCVFLSNILYREAAGKPKMFFIFFVDHCTTVLTSRGDTGESHDGVKLEGAGCALHFRPAEVYYCERGGRLCNIILMYSLLSPLYYLRLFFLFHDINIKIDINIQPVPQWRLSCYMYFIILTIKDGINFYLYY